MYICMYVGMSVCIFVCMYVCKHTHNMHTIRESRVKHIFLINMASKLK